MESLLLLIFAVCLLVGVVGSNAAPLPSEIYWKNKLLNTPMPAILHDLLHPAPAADQQGEGSTDKLPDYIAYNFTWLRKIKNTTNLEQANSQKCSKTQNDNAACERQLQDNAGASLFFLEKNLYPGAKMNVHFVVGTRYS
ncbi:BURP domain-containing protein 2-like [Papaver somniferum]|uniref:BURP domain-containing protein 2-like n=1 Tax=Papaver somniferum TaxID=3469 RepID=UPI000E70411F|nr:BURP domain-containing protein 2-like [Papaver somniferum]